MIVKELIEDLQCLPNPDRLIITKVSIDKSTGSIKMLFHQYSSYPDYWKCFFKRYLLHRLLLKLPFYRRRFYQRLDAAFKDCIKDN